MKRLLVPILLMASSMVYAQGCDGPVPPVKSLVYSRQPRMEEKYENWHRFYDAGAPDRHSELDLVLDNLIDPPKVIFDCTSKTNLVCAAEDARVSPDGKNILFTVATGVGLYPVQLWGTTEKTPPIEFSAVSYALYVYNVESGTYYKLEDNARQGDWLSNTDIVFASNRAGTFPPRAMGSVVPNYNVKALQIYRGKIRENRLIQIVNLTPESPFAMSPTVTHDGLILYSEWDGFGDRVGGHTPANFWWGRSMNADGTNNIVILNGHGTPTLKTVAYLKGIVDPNRALEGSTQVKLPRPMREVELDWIYFTNYYRSNHSGSGIEMKFKKNVTGAEGYSQSASIGDSDYKLAFVGSGRYTPNLFVVTPSDNDQDTTNVGARYHVNGKIMGKSRAPAPTIAGHGRFIDSHGRGSCYEGTVTQYNSVLAMGGEPTCQYYIREVLVERVTDPFDETQSKPLACYGTEFNCIDPSWVVPYSELPFNTEAPFFKEYVASNATTTTLHIVDARAGELQPLVGPNYTEKDKRTYQGLADPNYPAVVTHMKVEAIKNWTTVPSRSGFESQVLLGLFPIENLDGSMSIDLPCNVNYLFSGVDVTGKTVAEDQTVHRANCGEVVTCHGCHDGHSFERLEKLGKTAVERFTETTAGSKGRLPVLDNP